MTTTNDGLTTNEIEAVMARYGAERCRTGEAETGAAYVVVATVGQDEDGDVTQTVCRERGIVAKLDRAGAVLAEGDSVEAVLDAR